MINDRESVAKKKIFLFFTGVRICVFKTNNLV